MADRAGLALPQDGYDDTLMKQRRRMLEANREAARYFMKRSSRPRGRQRSPIYRAGASTRK